MRPGRLVASAVVSAFLVSSGYASAATIVPDVPCKRERGIAGFTGTGFAPGGTVELQLGGLPAGSVVAAPDGTIRGSVEVPSGVFAPQGTPYPLAASDGAAAATATLMSVRGDATLAPKTATTRRSRLQAAGLSNRRPVYAHVRVNGRWVRTRRLARRPAGVCGTINVRARPVLRGLRGLVYIQLDGRRKPSLSTRPQTWVKVGIQAGSIFGPEKYRHIVGGFRD